MKSPFKILGVNISDIGSKVQSLQARKIQLEKVRQMYESMFRNKGLVNLTRHSISDGTIEGDLNERFILGLPITSRYFSDVDIEELLSKIDELKQKDDYETEGRDTSKMLNQSLVNQSKLVGKKCSEYSEVLRQYKENPNDTNSINAIIDLHIRQSYEEQLVQLAQEVSQSLQPVEKIGKDDTFITALMSHPKYKELAEAYSKIATVEGRRDCIPELYVLSRLGSETDFTGLSDEQSKRILAREEKHRQNWLNEMTGTEMPDDVMGYPENQNHDYGWGMVLQDPKFIMKDEYVDTSDFNGKITVENIGAFTSESLFKKVHNPRKFGAPVQFNGNIDEYVKKLQKLTTTEHHGKTMRKAFYKHEATMTKYNYIYRVTKTDTEGRATSDIVFSPLHPKEIGKYDQKFVRELYFSNCVLDKAKINNGFVGRVEDYPKENNRYSITTEYCEEELAAALLFANGIRGKISDNRGGKKVIHEGVTNADFLRILNAGERERTHDE